MKTFEERTISFKWNEIPDVFVYSLGAMHFGKKDINFFCALDCSWSFKSGTSQAQGAYYYHRFCYRLTK